MPEEIVAARTSYMLSISGPAATFPWPMLYPVLVPSLRSAWHRCGRTLAKASTSSAKCIAAPSVSAPNGRRCNATRRLR